MRADSSTDKITVHGKNRGRNSALKNLTPSQLPDPAFPNFEHLDVGPDDRGGGFIATPADSWEVLVTADTLQGALQSLDRFVGTPVAKTQEDYVRAAIEFANSDSSIPWGPRPEL